MTTATATVAAAPTTVPITAHPVRRATLVAGATAAAATTAVAAVADAAGVPFAVDGETIPLLGFAQLTAVGAVAGGLLAAFVVRRRQAFVAVAVVLTALSCIPSVVMPPDTATRMVLVLTHLLAAAIIVPALARQIRR